MSELKKHILAGAILAVFTAIFFCESLSGSEVFVTTGLIKSDLMGQSYPGKVFYADKLQRGELPLWSKNVGAGYPITAESQLGAFYPFNFLFFSIFPMPWAFNFSLVFHFFLASLFTYFLMRLGFRKSLLVGIFSGLCFGLSGFFATHLSHLSMIQVAAFFPLVFLLMKRQFDKPSWSNFFGLVFVSLFQVLAGHLQILYYFHVALMVYFFARTAASCRGGVLARSLVSAFCPFLTLGGALVLAFLLASFQIFPSLEFIANSERYDGISFSQAADYQFPLSHLLWFVFPKMADFSKPARYNQLQGTVSPWETYGYLGVLPFILAAIAVFVSARDIFLRKRCGRGKGSAEVWWVFGLGFFALLLAFGKATPFFEVLWRVVPFMRLFQFPTRLLVLVSLSLAVLAGFGLAILLPPAKEESPNFSESDSFPSDSRELAGGYGSIRKLVLFLVITLSFFDLYFHNRLLNSTANAAWWLSEPASAVLLKERLGSNYRYSTNAANAYDYRLIKDAAVQKELQSLLPPNFNLIFKLPCRESVFGIDLDRDEIYFKTLSEFLWWRGGTDLIVASDSYIRFLSLSASKYLLSGLTIEHPDLFLEEFWDFERPLGYELYLAGKGDPVVVGVKSSGVHLYRNEGALPRARFVENVFWVEDGEESLTALQNGEFDPETTVVLERTPFDGAQGRQMEQINTDKTDLLDLSKSVRSVFLEDEDQRVVIKVTAPTDGYLVLSDTYYPGWKAYRRRTQIKQMGTDRTDGEEVEILRANYNFRAVPVSEGDSVVTFSYEPESFRNGLVVSVLSLAVLVGLAVYWRLHAGDRR